MDPPAHDTGVSRRRRVRGASGPPTNTSTDTLTGTDSAADAFRKTGDTIRQAVRDVAGQQKQAGDGRRGPNDPARAEARRSYHDGPAV